MNGHLQRLRFGEAADVVPRCLDVGLRGRDHCGFVAPTDGIDDGAVLLHGVVPLVDPQNLQPERELEPFIRVSVSTR